MSSGKRKRSAAKQRSPVRPKGITSAEPPTNVMQAILAVAWGLPRWAKYVVVLMAAVVISAFALWLSIPEKKREEAIDTLLKKPAKSSPISLAEARRRGVPIIIEGSLTVPEMEDLFVELRTTEGKIKIDLLPAVAPNHVRNFVDLAAHGFYDGTRFHFVHPLYLIQGGDPNSKVDDRSGWGRGGGPVTLEAEFNATPHERGTVSMALGPDDPDSASSQFFICVERRPEFDGNHTVFGKVVQGMDVVDRIAAGARDHRTKHPYHPIAIERAIVLRRSDGSEWKPHGHKQRGLTSR